MHSSIDDPSPWRLVAAVLAAVLTLAPPAAGANAPSHAPPPQERPGATRGPAVVGARASRTEAVFTHARSREHEREREGRRRAARAQARDAHRWARVDPFTPGPFGGEEGSGEDDAASDTRIPIPEVGVDSVAGGDRVTVRWSGLPPDIEEMEILLSLDDGRHFERRVSPELEGDVMEYTWIVPDLAAAHARLRMRARRDGREVEGPIGPAFTLISRGRTRDTWTFRDAGVPAPDEAATHAGGWLATPGSRLGRAVDAAGSAEAPVRVAFGRRPPRVALGGGVPAASSPAPAATGTPPLRHRPLRN